MTVTLNHRFIPSHDKHASARFLADLFGLEVSDKSLGSPPGRFAVVRVRETNLDYDDIESFEPQHYAFLVGSEQFEAILEQINGCGISFSADPPHRKVGEVRQDKDGWGFYFHDPNGHNLEIVTRD